MALERSPNQRWRRRSIPQLMTAHVFLICLIFRSSLSPDSGAKPTVSPRFQRKVGDTTTVAAWKMSRRRHDARSQSADGTVGRLQRRPLMMIDDLRLFHNPEDTTVE
ncbi:predicted protein [Chaetomium globosum CBS 148.51]|uniref:Uncharacterized protein n=1 Tax=Chaetomium globosum (strain ATCC 6205 / CBS 148.51 / DSM 1962 / NBRC 6347 / NRRL 1970) TaxID=306901 RepID=Q2HBI3_CHAGB|nr:uncharacterized protein CHGG_02421 [Chaetomium globosum CBS 148.51]EAQ90486.1 predicted protein [Chaetomium globosum CBS 148.51]